MKKLLNTIYVTNPDSYLSLDGDNLVVMREERKYGCRCTMSSAS